MDPFFAHYKDQDSPSSAYGHIVRRLPALALRPDVHCAVPIHVEAVSDHRALLCTEGQAIGEETLPILPYNHIYFYWRDALEDAAGRGRPDVFGVAVAHNGGLLAAAIAHQVVHVALPAGHLRRGAGGGGGGRAAAASGAARAGRRLR